MPEPLLIDVHTDGRTRVHVETVDQWGAWLERHHSQADGVWLVTFKKAARRPAPTYDDAVSEALRFGWVDSKPAKLDEERTMLYYAPRKSGSAWSGPNKQRVDRLVAAGRMAPAGAAAVAAARADGTWSMLDAVEALEIPDDLSAAFERHPGSAQQWDGFPRSAKRGILEWIIQAKRAETRASRVDETARLAAIGERANQWPRGTR